MKVAYCFDFDGTLFDLPVDIEPVRTAIGEEFARRGHHAEMRPLLAAIDAGVAAVEAELDAREALRQKLLDMITAAECVAAGQARMRQGVLEVLARLRQEGTPWGIATDNAARAVLASFAAAGAAELIDGVPIVGRGDIPRAKPAPDAVVAVLRALCGADAASWHCVVIGDSPRDIEAARAAAVLLAPHSVKAVAVLGGRGDEASLRAANPDAVGTSFPDAMQGAGTGVASGDRVRT